MLITVGSTVFILIAAVCVFALGFIAGFQFGWECRNDDYDRAVELEVVRRQEQAAPFNPPVARRPHDDIVPPREPQDFL